MNNIKVTNWWIKVWQIFSIYHYNLAKVLSSMVPNTMYSTYNFYVCDGFLARKYLHYKGLKVGTTHCYFSNGPSGNKVAHIPMLAKFLKCRIITTYVLHNILTCTTRKCGIQVDTLWRYFSIIGSTYHHVKIIRRSSSINHTVFSANTTWKFKMFIFKKVTSVTCNQLTVKIKNQMKFLLLQSILTNIDTNAINSTSELYSYKMN